MDRIKTLSRLDKFHKYVCKELRISVGIFFTSKEENVESFVDANDVHYIRVATDSSVLDDTCNIVDEYAFVEAVIHVAHELHHAAVLLQSRKVGKDIISLSESYVSRFNNNAVYERDYDKFSYEIEAERYALKITHKYLHDNFPTLDTDAIMLDYVNAKATEKTSSYAYPVRTDHRFESMEQVFTALDKAYDQSFVVKKHFMSRGNFVSDVLVKDDKLKQGFVQAVDGKEQTKFAAIIVLNHDPSLFNIFKSLKPKRYDLKQIYDARNRKFDNTLDNQSISRGYENTDDYDDV